MPDDHEHADESDAAADQAAEATPRAHRSVAVEQLVALARRRFHVFTTVDEGPMAALLPGHVGGGTLSPHTAVPLSGDAFKNALAAICYRELRRAPRGVVIDDAVRVLAGQELEQHRVNFRVARPSNDVVIIDLARPDNQCVVVRAGREWALSEEPQVWFRRSRVTAPQVLPTAGGDLAALRGFINVTDEDWPLLVGWLVATLLQVVTPALSLTGVQGAGKTTAARILIDLTDPSTAATRAAVGADRHWMANVRHSHVVCFDNMSTVSAQLSDLICNTITGGGLVTRKLWTDDDPFGISVRRCLIFTSIDLGAVRGDLLERLVPIELHHLSATSRRTERQLDEAWQRQRPQVLGALLTLLCAVLHDMNQLPAPTELPRMADYGRVLAAVDRQMHTNGLETYVERLRRETWLATAGDPLLAALDAFLDAQPDERWTGTPQQLLQHLKAGGDHAGCPETANLLSARLRRLARGLEAHALRWEKVGHSNIGSKYRLHRVARAEATE